MTVTRDEMRTIARTVLHRDRVSVLDEIPPDHHAAIQARTSTYDATAAIQRLLDAHDYVYVPPGTYQHTGLTITRAGVTLAGAGGGLSILENVAAGSVGVKVDSGGGVNPSLLNVSLRGLRLQGAASTSHGLWLYDCHYATLEDVEVIGHGGDGLRCEIVLVSTILGGRFFSNTGVGIRLARALKDGISQPSNAVTFVNVGVQLNAAGGVQIEDCDGHRFYGGDIQNNGTYGCAILGGSQNVLDSVWFEVNTNPHLRIGPTAGGGGLTLYNRVRGCFFLETATSNSSVEVTAGSHNYFDSNLIGGTLTVGAAAVRTIVMPQTELGGTFTDNGSDTVNLHDPRTEGYWKNGTEKRLFFNATGTGAQIGSDLALDLLEARSITTSSTAGSNLAGQVDIADPATSAVVTFTTAEPDGSYTVTFGVRSLTGAPAAGALRPSISALSATGFTVALEAAPGAGASVRVYWHLIRI